MAVLKPDLSWSTLQEKQLTALKSIETTAIKDLAVSKDLKDGLSDVVSATYQAANIIVHGIDAIWNSKDFENFLRDMPSSTRDLGHTFEDVAEDIKEAVEDSQEQDRREYEMMDKEFLEDLGDKLVEFLKEQYKIAAEHADEYSSIYNDIIRFTGSNENEAQRFRRDIIDQVSSINKDLGGIGGKLDPEESLRTMIAISNRTNISNLETLKELTAPVLLAQETTNMNLDELAKLGGRMYTRYSMESGSLENFVNHIRNVTEGQDVNEDDILTAVAMVETRLGLQYRGDASMIEKASESLASGIAFLESNYVTADSYIDDIYRLFSTDPTDKQVVMSKYSGDYDEILALAQSGDIARAMELMLEHTSEISTLTAKGLGHDAGAAEEAQLWAMTGKTLEEFYESVEKDATARERAADKYVSLEQQVYNKLSEVTSYLATIQENMGVGLSDIAVGVSAASTIASNIKTLKGIERLLGGTGGAGGASAAGGIAGMLTKFGPALGVAGTAVGLAVLVKGIYDKVEGDKEDEVDKYQGVLGEASSEYGYKRVGTYNASTGETDWSYEAIQSKEEADAYAASKSAMQQSYKQDQWDSLGFWGKASYRTLAAFQNWGVTQAGGGASDYVRAEDLYKGNIQSVIDPIEELLSDPTYDAVRMFYANTGLLGSEDQIDKFAENKDKYLDAYNSGMYLAGDKWYYVTDDTLVPSNKAPAAFAGGTNYIDRDQLAYLHKGEAVTPAKYNPANNMNELERLRSQESQESSADMETIISLLSGIQGYLQYWKEDADKKDSINNSRGMTAQRANMLSYFTGGR